MLFHERVVARGDLTEAQPLWVCRCGIEVRVRVPFLDRRPAPVVLGATTQLKTASLHDLRESLAEVRARAKAQRERAVSLRERTRASLMEAQRLVSVSALALDRNARHLAANRAASILTGYSEAELLQMSVWDLTGTPREQAWLQFIDRGRRAGICLLRRKTGTLIAVRYVAGTDILPGVHVATMAPRESAV